MIVQIYQGRRGWHVRLVSSNGRILTSSEAYYSRWNAKRAASRMFPDEQPIVLDRREVTG